MYESHWFKFEKLLQSLCETLRAGFGGNSTVLAEEGERTGVEDRVFLENAYIF